MLDDLIKAAVGALAGAVLLYASAWPTDTLVPYPVVYVKEIKGEPDTVPSFVDRLVTREVPVEGPVIIAPQQAQLMVDRFCAPMVTPGEVVVDTVVVMRSIAYDPGWFWRPDMMTAYLVENTGDLREQRYSLRGPWEARTNGRDLVVREPRISLQGLVEALSYAGLGYGVCRLAP